MSGPSEDEIREAFNSVDVDGSGFIESSEMPKVCEHLGVEPSQEAMDALLAEADTSGDGKVSFEEFCKVYNSD
jgi:Ca2+-binding EF-hand superfamily protein